MLQQRMLSSPDSIAYQDAVGVANTCAHSIDNTDGHKYSNDYDHSDRGKECHLDYEHDYRHNDNRN